MLFHPLPEVAENSNRFWLNGLRPLSHSPACLTVEDSVTLPQSFSASIIQDGGWSKLDEVPGYI